MNAEFLFHFPYWEMEEHRQTDIKLHHCLLRPVKLSVEELSFQLSQAHQSVSSIWETCPVSHCPVFTRLFPWGIPVASDRRGQHAHLARIWHTQYTSTRVEKPPQRYRPSKKRKCSRVLQLGVSWKASWPQVWWVSAILTARPNLEK